MAAPWPKLLFNNLLSRFPLHPYQVCKGIAVKLPPLLLHLGRKLNTHQNAASSGGVFRVLAMANQSVAGTLGHL